MIIQMYGFTKKGDIIPHDTCFAARDRCSSPCDECDCRFWIKDITSQNCSLIAAGRGGMTLEQIGQVFGLTRMRVCQIEKKIYEKIINQLSEDRQVS